MNERIQHLIDLATTRIHTRSAPFGAACVTESFDKEKFAELIIQEHAKLLQQEWYRLNDLPKFADDTLRDIGMRVGKKSEIVLLQALFKNHFGIKSND